MGSLATWCSVSMSEVRRRIPPQADDFAAGRMTQEHVEPREPDWIWPNWLACDMLHVLEGDEGTGKSLIANWLVSVASNPDSSWPGGDGVTGLAVHLYAEESPYQFTTARDLRANGAVLSNVFMMKAGSFYRGLGNLDWWCHQEELPKPDIVVFDTWAHYSARDDIDEIKNAEITSALGELAELCEEHHIAGLVLMHTRKYSKSGSVRERGRGASAHRAVPRLVWSVEVDHGQPEKPRVLARTKENLRVPLEGGLELFMRGDQSLTYKPLEGFGPDLIAAAMRSSEEAAPPPTKADLVMAHIDEHGGMPFRELATALGWSSKELSNAILALPGWTRPLTMEEQIEFDIDARGRFVERPS